MMTISSDDAAALGSTKLQRIAGHPIYASVLASLPLDRPIPLTEILAQQATHARQLATVLLVATTFEHILEGCRVLPQALVSDALKLLSPSEQQRLLKLFVEYLQQVNTQQALNALQDLPSEWKLAAWSQLSHDTQIRLHTLQRGRSHR